MDKFGLVEQNGRRFEFLDSLRGIAAFLVLFHHFHNLIGERSTIAFPQLLEHLFKNGHFGVQIFFVLSGFVIAYSIRYELMTFPFIMRFFIRRSIRLDPPYWITLIILTFLILLGPLLFNQGSQYVPSFKVFMLNAIYLPEFFNASIILPVAWTLCLEFQFYIFFVFLIKAIQHFNIWKKQDAFNYSSSFSLILLFSLLLLSLLQTAEWNFWTPIRGLFLPYWYSFFLGCLTCWVIQNRIEDKFFWLAIILTGVVAAIMLNGSMTMTLFTSLMIFSVAKRDKLHETLNNGVFQYMGKISYSLYLIHWPVGIKLISLIFFIFGPYMYMIHPLVVMLTTLLITIVAAHFFYKYVELPSIDLCKKIGKAKSTPLQAE